MALQFSEAVINRATAIIDTRLTVICKDLREAGINRSVIMVILVIVTELSAYGLLLFTVTSIRRKESFNV